MDEDEVISQLLAAIPESYQAVTDSGATNHLISATYEKFLKEAQPVNVIINVAKRGQKLIATNLGIIK